MPTYAANLETWKEIYISKMNFINPELNFKNDTRKIKNKRHS